MTTDVRYGACFPWGLVGSCTWLCSLVVRVDQFFDAALGELGVVARGPPSLIVGCFNVEPTKIPCLLKGITAGLWVDLEAAWAGALGVDLAVTCKRCCGCWRKSEGLVVGFPVAAAAVRSLGGCNLTLRLGRRRDFMVGCTLAATAVSSCRVGLDRWVAPHLTVRT